MTQTQLTPNDSVVGEVLYLMALPDSSARRSNEPILGEMQS